MINLLVLYLIYKEIMLNVIDFNMNYFLIIYYFFLLEGINIDIFLDIFLDILPIRLHGENHNLLKGFNASVWMYRCLYT